MEMIGNEELCAPRVKDLNLANHHSESVAVRDGNDNSVNMDDNYIDKSMQVSVHMITETKSQLKYELFVKSFVYLYIMHNRVNLVHADFSSYNLL